MSYLLQRVFFIFHLGSLERFFLFLNDILECLGELRRGPRRSNAQKNNWINEERTVKPHHFLIKGTRRGLYIYHHEITTIYS